MVDVSSVPQHVVCHVQRQVDKLAILSRARKTDEMADGGGRYEAEVYLNRKAELDLAWGALRKFEELCVQNNVDPKTVYASVGHPTQLSEASQTWIAVLSKPMNSPST
jgi:hypothetical protein